MSISIIIPTYNRACQLSRTLDSIKKLNTNPNEFEIIIVDNASKDNTKQIVDQFINKNKKNTTRYFFDDIPGLLSGRHRGAKEANGDVLIFIDDDVRVHRNWLNNIKETFNKYSEVGIVGGKCLPLYENTPPEWLKYFWRYISKDEKVLPELSLCDYGEKEKKISPKWVWGLNFSIRKETFRKLGGFNPDCIPHEYQYFQGDGETGLSIKAIECGCEAMYQPNAIVYHEVPSSRMTIEYFDKRYFYSGICNSYTKIRHNHGIKSHILLIEKFIALKGKLYQTLIQFLKQKSKVSFEQEMLFARFNCMENAGYEYHQKMARSFPVILDWILKEDYLNYDFRKLLKKM